MGRSAKIAASIGGALALIATLVAVVSRSRTASPHDSAPRVVAATGTGHPTFTVSRPAHAPAFTLSRFARPLGPAYRINASRPAAGSRVSFTVDRPDLAPRGGYHPSTTNLFVAVYEPGVNTWVPLASHYDPRTNTVSAIAPHFSWFRKGVVTGVEEVGTGLADGAKVVKNAATSGYHVVQSEVTGVMEFAQQIYDGVATAVHDELYPEQKKADCSNADASYTIQPASHASKFPGCVTGASPPVVQMENHFSLPFGLRADGTHPRTPWGTYDSMVDFIAGLYYKGLDGTYLPPHGYGAAAVGSDLADRHQWGATLHLDWFAFGAAVVLGALSVTPPGREFVEINASLKVVLTRIVDEHGVTDVRTLLLELKAERKNVDKPEVLDHIGAFSDMFTCLRRASDNVTYAVVHADIEHLAEAEVAGAKGCLAALLGALVGTEKSAITASINGVFDEIGLLRGAWQAAFAGTGLYIIDVQVAHSETPPPTSDVYFPQGVTDIHDPVQKPSELDSTGDGSEWFTSVQWSSWGPTSATGAGTVHFACYVCSPGQPHQYEGPARVTLDQPLVACGTKFFSRVSVHVDPSAPTFYQHDDGPRVILDVPAEKGITPSGKAELCPEVPPIVPAPAGAIHLGGPSAFVTPSGNITCLNSSIASAERTGNTAPAVDEQSVECFIGAHAWTAPACTGPPGTAATVNYYGLGTATGCAGQSRTLLPAASYAAQYGDIIDLGPARCTVTQKDVTCVGGSDPNHGFHLSRAAFIDF